MPFRLTESEIRKRLAEGRNYKRLYKDLKVKYNELKAENKRLKTRVAELEEIVETQSIQIAELQTYIFGKKPKSSMPNPKARKTPPFLTTITIPRSFESYHRALPTKDEITSTRHYSLPAECSCGGHFKNVTTKHYYEEDIALPELTVGYRPKLVTHHIVECARCSLCGKRLSAASDSLNTSCLVSIGPNIRLWVTHMTTVLGLSYAQVAQLAAVQFNIKLSDGEIANILKGEHLHWLSTYEQIRDSIRASPAKHYDETPWPIQSEQLGHVWVMSDASSTDTVYQFTMGRGKKYIKRLHEGSDPDSVYTTDGYGAYKNLSGHHQLCWAHLYRAIRDLAENSNLPKSKHAWVADFHRRFGKIYADLRAELAKPYDETTRVKVADELWSRVSRLTELTRKGIKDPDKLRKLKQQLKEAGKDKLFVCLIKNTPCDNNRAERDLRQLVLKRKRSFGSKTLKGAKTLSTVMSVCTTIWRRYQDNPSGYFRALAGV